jgi:hypothetical protein
MTVVIVVWCAVFFFSFFQSHHEQKLQKQNRYVCTNATATFGSWNITLLTEETPGCKHLGVHSMNYEWWNANIQNLVTSTPGTVSDNTVMIVTLSS